MNSILKTLGLIISIVGCVSTTMVWINVPVVGEIKGVSNPAGIIALGGFIFCAILYFISYVSEERGVYWTLLFLSAIPLVSGFYYYQNIQKVVEQLTALSQISIFGVSAGDYYDVSKVIEWRNGFQITMVAGGISLFLAIVLLLSDDTKVNVQPNKQSVSNQSQPPLESKKIVSNFDNEPYIQKLKELFELNNKGVLPNDIFEDEKHKILEQQKADKIKFEEAYRELLTDSLPKTPRDPNRPSYISKPIPQKKTIDPNVVFIIAVCLLLIGFAVYSLAFNKNKPQNNELSKINNDSIGLVNSENKTVKSDSEQTINFPIYTYNKLIDKSYYEDGGSVFPEQFKEYYFLYGVVKRVLHEDGIVGYKIHVTRTSKEFDNLHSDTNSLANQDIVINLFPEDLYSKNGKKRNDVGKYDLSFKEYKTLKKLLVEGRKIKFSYVEGGAGSTGTILAGFLFFNYIEKID